MKKLSRMTDYVVVCFCKSALKPLLKYNKATLIDRFN